MGRCQVTVVLAATLLAATFVLPLADADHCKTRIHAFGRMGIAPTPPPPHSYRTMSMCRTLHENGVVDTHAFPPGTDQVFVRLAADPDPSTKTFDAVFDGLGFVNESFTLHRVPAQDGLHSYELKEWAFLPHGPKAGTLTVTVYMLGSVTSVTYTSSG